MRIWVQIPSTYVEGWVWWYMYAAPGPRRWSYKEILGAYWLVSLANQWTPGRAYLQNNNAAADDDDMMMGRGTEEDTWCCLVSTHMYVYPKMHIYTCTCTHLTCTCVHTNKKIFESRSFKGKEYYSDLLHTSSNRTGWGWFSLAISMLQTRPTTVSSGLYIYPF